MPLIKENPTLTIDLDQEVVIPKQYYVNSISDTIIIDGIANEKSWADAEFTDYFTDIEGDKEPHFKTRAKMLWSEHYFYVYAELQEPHVWGDITDRDQIIYLNNDFEVFIDPSSNLQNYGEFEINALGTEWDLLLDKPYSNGGNPIFNWNIAGLESAVKVYGTINNHNDEDSLWTVEIAFPIRSLTELKLPPKTIPVHGEVWRINFSRVQWDYEIFEGQYRRKRENDKLLPEYNWVWSPHYEINMHQPDKWGYIVFNEDSEAERTDVLQSEIFYKQIAYAIWRKIKFDKNNELNQLNPYQSKNLILNYQKKSYNAVFNKTKFGFEIALYTEENKTLYINEEGIIRIENE
jgi:hypothetical protein